MSDGLTLIPCQLLSLRYRIGDRVYKTSQAKTFSSNAATIAVTTGNATLTRIIATVREFERNPKFLTAPHDICL